MSDIDQMTDESSELCGLREALHSMDIPERPSLEAITARGRARRRHQRATRARLCVAGLAAGGLATLGLSGAFRGSSTLSTIHAQSFTLARYTNGMDKLTINPGELLNPSELQSDLAKYGIPAKVTTGRYCTSDPQPSGFSQVVSGPGPGSWRDGSGEGPTITIDPSAMPSGTELSVGDFQLSSGEQQANVSLIDSGSNTCSATPPALAPDTPGLGVLYGGAGSTGS